MQNSVDQELLKVEARYLLSGLFSVENDERIESLYVEAHNVLFKKPTINIEGVDISKIVKSRLDSEAIEFALRISNRDNLLTKKIQILTYLIEAHKRYNQKFNNFENRFLFGFVSLAILTLRSIYLLVKGKVLINIYNLKKSSITS